MKEYLTHLLITTLLTQFQTFLSADGDYNFNKNTMAVWNSQSYEVSKSKDRSAIKTKSNINVFG